MVKLWWRVCISLLVIWSSVACSQEQDEGDGDESVQTEIKEKDAAKAARKAERRSRKEKKSGSKVQLPPPPDASAEFEFFDGAIFSRKVNLGSKGVLCFASERRPVAMLWQEGGASSPMKLSARELQLIFGRPVEASQVSVLNASSQMLARGTTASVAVNLGRKPVYLLVETAPSRPQAAELPADEASLAYHENLSEVRVYPDPQRAKGPRTIVFANLTQQATIQILAGEKIVFEIANPGTPLWKWDGYDQNRQPLPRGQYHYRILAKGASATGIFELSP